MVQTVVGCGKADNGFWLIPLGFAAGGMHSCSHINVSHGTLDSSTFIQKNLDFKQEQHKLKKKVHMTYESPFLFVLLQNS